ncbi:MAG: bifunctional folylpolyglutamate synthase/dihydrofolate synthase [Desulfobacula sp.]|nr:bifunctional folylpolyglutamate synthase/dihydrofolate synthase [Desulfobacula sp.]
MKKISYEECLQTIYKLGRFGIKLELDTIFGILERLGTPHKHFRKVHIAGTNGKGSTAAYIAAILKQAGFKTGLFTSPHLVRFNERIVVDGKEISNDGVVEAYEAVNAADIGERKATYFEIATAMAFYHFAREKVDWAVIETGMGGRFDATNVIVPQVSVITNLSLEHTEYLGNTIKALAREKSGIIKENTPVVTAVSQPSARLVLENLAREKSADLFFLKKAFSIDNKIDKKQGKENYTYRGLYNLFHDLVTPLPGKHQKENIGLALAACELIYEQLKEIDSSYCLTEDTVREGLALAKWPGRLEIVQQNPLLILDGAHNLNAAKVLGEYLASILKGRKLTLVLGILDDKPFEKMLQKLVPLAHRVILSRAKIDRSIDPFILKKAAQQLTHNPVSIIESVKDAVTHALKTSDSEDIICIAGSLYVVGEAKEILDC